MCWETIILGIGSMCQKADMKQSVLGTACLMAGVGGGTMGCAGRKKEREEVESGDGQIWKTF